MLRSIPGLEVIAKSFIGQNMGIQHAACLPFVMQVYRHAIMVIQSTITMEVCSHAGPAAEQVLLLENIATSIKIGPDQLSSVHKLLIEAAQVLEMTPPELYVRQASEIQREPLQCTPVLICIEY